MTSDVHKIFEAYVAPAPVAKPAMVPPVRPQVGSVPPVSNAPLPVQQNTTPAAAPSQTPLTLKLPIDTERKAQHAAFDILEHIYSNVPNFATATSIVAEIVRVHRREAKRQAKLG